MPRRPRGRSSDDVASHATGSEPSWGRLYRDGRRAWLAGVCAGIADYFGLNPCLVRALTVASAVFFTFPTVVAYLIAAFALPRRPADMYDSPEEEAFWRSVRLEPGRTAHDLSAQVPGARAPAARRRGPGHLERVQAPPPVPRPRGLKRLRLRW